jgi:hypothetical protein
MQGRHISDNALEMLCHMRAELLLFTWRPKQFSSFGHASTMGSNKPERQLLGLPLDILRLILERGMRHIALALTLTNS